MFLTAALSLALFASQDAKPVTLNRVFTKGEKDAYSVASNLHVEARQYGLQTFIPDDLDLSYKFTSEVKDLKNDGVALIHYLRPNVVEVQEATYDEPAKRTVDKINFNFDLTVSPINVILDQKDLNPPKPPPKKTGGGDGGDGDGGGRPFLSLSGAMDQGPLGGMMGTYVDELYRLALNIGDMDSAMDYSPKLPLDDVKVGDTWQKTVSYQPQKLKGKNGKQAVQRLDYTFTYKGIVNDNGKQYYRINAALNLNTDLATFINQLLDAKPSETHLKSIPLKLKQSIDFDLDMATKRTVSAVSKADGGFSFSIIDTDEPILEENITGTTEMHLLSVGTATPAPKVVPKHHGGY